MQMLQMQMQLAQDELKLEQAKAAGKADVDDRAVAVKEGQLALNELHEQNDMAVNVAEVGLEAQQGRAVGIGD